MVASTVLLASSAYTPDEVAGPVAVQIDGGHVVSVSALDAAPTDAVDLRPWRIAPGFVDLHAHGFAGHDVTTGLAADIAAMAAALPATGVTAFYPTIASTGPAETLAQVRAIGSLGSVAGASKSAQMLGIRLEGPFINPRKRGAQYAGAIRPADVGELARLCDSGPVAMVDFAPELDADFALLRALVQRGVAASIGHTAATFAEASAALDAGATHCTHLFNAMPPLEHRAPGCVGALLGDTRATVEMIADGVHLHPLMLRLVVALRGPSSVALITDAMDAAGLPEGRYTFVGRQVDVRDGAVRLADGTLAGSVLTMDRAVRNMVELAGAQWSDAIRMATLTPASIAAVAARKGHLHPGADADLVVLDEAGVLQQTYVRGELAFSRY